MDKFRINLKKKRKEHGLSAKSLAEKLGITHQSVSSWERGESMPSTGKLEKLAEILGTTVSMLMDVEETQPPVPSGYVLIEKQTLEAQEREIEYLRKIVGLQEENNKLKNIEVVSE